MKKILVVKGGGRARGNTARLIESFTKRVKGGRDYVKSKNYSIENKF